MSCHRQYLLDKMSKYPAHLFTGILLLLLKLKRIMDLIFLALSYMYMHH